jgi:hypothetical protein
VGGAIANRSGEPDFDLGEVGPHESGELFAGQADLAADEEVQH